MFAVICNSCKWAWSTTLIAGSAFFSRSPVRSQCEREPQGLCWLTCIAALNLLLHQPSLHFSNVFSGIALKHRPASIVWTKNYVSIGRWTAIVAFVSQRPGLPRTTWLIIHFKQHVIVSCDLAFVLVIFHTHQQTVRRSIQFLLYIIIIYLAASILLTFTFHYLPAYFSLTGLFESMK